jgi:hypothetical protein
MGDHVRPESVITFHRIERSSSTGIRDHDRPEHAPAMEPRHFSRALHKIKAANDLSGLDRVVIYSDGRVTDEQGEPFGNLHDED